MPEIGTENKLKLWSKIESFARPGNIVWAGAYTVLVRGCCFRGLSLQEPRQIEAMMGIFPPLHPEGERQFRALWMHNPAEARSCASYYNEVASLVVPQDIRNEFGGECQDDINWRIVNERLMAIAVSPSMALTIDKLPRLNERVARLWWVLGISPQTALGEIREEFKKLL